MSHKQQRRPLPSVLPLLSLSSMGCSQFRFSNPCAGEFEKMTGEFGGMGNYVWGSCGRRYVGYFKANQPDGHGELKFPQVRAQLKVFSFRFRVKCWLFGHWSFGKKAECFFKQMFGCISISSVIGDTAGALQYSIYLLCGRQTGNGTLGVK